MRKYPDYYNGKPAKNGTARKLLLVAFGSLLVVAFYLPWLIFPFREMKYTWIILGAAVGIVALGILCIPFSFRKRNAYEYDDIIGREEENLQNDSVYQTEDFQPRALMDEHSATKNAEEWKADREDDASSKEARAPSRRARKYYVTSRLTPPQMTPKKTRPQKEYAYCEEEPVDDYDRLPESNDTERVDEADYTKPELVEADEASEEKQAAQEASQPTLGDARELTPEERLLNNKTAKKRYAFNFHWDNLPKTKFEDVAGLEEVKETVRVKVLLPIQNPDAFFGYDKKNGGGVLLYGPPGTGKTMIAAAIANEIGAKFCAVSPSDLIQQGAGNSEKAVSELFAQAREFPCSVVYFDEMDSISPKNTKSQYTKQFRSEFLAQLQGIESYGEETGHILFLIAATNKPWEIDSAFIRPGRFGTKIYVGLPDEAARAYIINNRLKKLSQKGVVRLHEDLDIDGLVEKTDMYNCSDITNLMDRIEEISVLRGIETGVKVIKQDDFIAALEEIHTSVQVEDIEKLEAWKRENT